MANPVVFDHILTIGPPDGFDGPFFLSEFYLLFNNYDPDMTALSVVGVSDSVGGQALLSSGSVEFQFDQGFVGTASFRYEIRDDQNESSFAFVRMVVDLDQQFGYINYWPFANPDTFATDEDVPITLLSTDLLANDVDYTGSEINIQVLSDFPGSIVSVGNAQNGSVVYNANAQTVTFTPAPNFNGVAGFDYTVIDSEGAFGTGQVTIIVEAVDDPLVALDDEIITLEDVAANISTAVLLSNDFDQDSNLLEVTGVSNPLNGQVSLSLTDDTVLFVPDPDFFGIAGFDYEVTNSEGQSAIAHVTVIVEPVDDPLVALDDEISTPEDVPATISAATLLANDFDVDSQFLSITDVSNPLNGQVSISLTDDTILFVPNPDFFGIAGFDYEVTNSEGQSAIARVTVNVLPENDDPQIATAGDLFTRINTSVASRILASDPDGDPLSFDFADPVNGTIVPGEDGAFSYQPDTGFIGRDSFVATVSDGFGGSQSVDISVLVVPNAPVRLSIGRPIAVPAGPGVPDNGSGNPSAGFPVPAPGGGDDPGDSQAVVVTRLRLSAPPDLDPSLAPTGAHHLTIG